MPSMFQREFAKRNADQPDNNRIGLCDEERIGQISKAAIGKIEAASEQASSASRHFAKGF